MTTQVTKREIDEFVSYGILFRQNAGVDRKDIQHHILFLSDCAVRNSPQEFIDHLIFMGKMYNLSVPENIERVHESPDLMTALAIGLQGTDNDRSFLIRPVNE